VAELHLHLAHNPITLTGLSDSELHAVIVSTAEWFHGLGGAWMGVPDGSSQRDVWIPATTELVAVWDDASLLGSSQERMPRLAEVITLNA
jgi:hypothetical protein